MHRQYLINIRIRKLRVQDQDLQDTVADCAPLRVAFASALQSRQENIPAKCWTSLSVVGSLLFAGWLGLDKAEDLGISARSHVGDTPTRRQIIFERRMASLAKCLSANEDRKLSLVSSISRDERPDMSSGYAELEQESGFNTLRCWGSFCRSRNGFANRQPGFTGESLYPASPS